MSSSHKKMKRPDVLCIGPQRCATTWLYSNLKKSPNYFSLISKELHYFDPLYIPKRKKFHEHSKHKASKFLGIFKFIPPKFGQQIAHILTPFYQNFKFVEKMYWKLGIPNKPNDDWYCSLFSKAKPNQITFDFTASYCMLNEKGISHILNINPDIKIILIIRDPIERALSHYKMVYEKNNYKLSIEDFLVQASDKDGFIYQQSDYSTILRKWQSAIKSSNIKICFYDDLIKDPAGYLQRICEFTGSSITEEMLDSSKAVVYPTKTPLVLDIKSKTQLYDLFKPAIAELEERFPERLQLFKTWHKRYTDV